MIAFLLGIQYITDIYRNGRGISELKEKCKIIGEEKRRDLSIPPIFYLYAVVIWLCQPLPGGCGTSSMCPLQFFYPCREGGRLLRRLPSQFRLCETTYPCRGGCGTSSMCPLQFLYPCREGGRLLRRLPSQFRLCETTYCSASFL